MDKNVLLRLDGVKMHFPLKKAHFFSRKRPYIKAVDGVSLDIYEGETFGLVGESGCGKSTLGRVILQLYKQTAGSVRYGGVTINDYAPDYAFRDASKVTQVKGTAEEIAEKFREQVKLIGGLLLSDDHSASARALADNLAEIRKVNVIQTEISLTEIKRAHYVEKKDDLTPFEQKHLLKLETKLSELAETLKKAEEKRDICDNKLNELRVSCVDKPGYQMLEGLRDISVDLSRLSKNEMRRMRRHLQIVFQDPYSSLNARFTVGQLISEALIAHNMFGRGTSQLEEYTLNVMDKCGLQNYFLHRYPHQFSGGQRQRIGIARALALQPRFVVCDEAVSALDVSIQSQIINLLMDLKERSNLTYLFISHDLSTVKFISDRVGVMYLGDLVELGDSDKIFDEPLHPYTNVLLDAIPTTEEASKKELQIIEGDVPSPIDPPPGCKFHTRCRYTTENCKKAVPEWRELRPNHWVACHYPIESGN